MMPSILFCADSYLSVIENTKSPYLLSYICFSNRKSSNCYID
nr:MAG TPA: hypothetical protein [Caudoviricetes sp.]